MEAVGRKPMEAISKVDGIQWNLLKVSETYEKLWKFMEVRGSNGSRWTLLQVTGGL